MITRVVLPATVLLCAWSSGCLGQTSARAREVWTLPSGTQLGAPPPRELDVEWERLFTQSNGGFDEAQSADAQPVSLMALSNPLKGKALQLIVRARKQVDGKQSADAIKTLQEALQYGPAKPYALLMLGTEHLKQTSAQPELVPVAVRELERGLADLPEDAGAHSNLAIALWLEGNYATASTEAKRGVQLNPADARGRFVLGTILASVGKVEEAKFHLKIASAEVEGARGLLVALERTNQQAEANAPQATEQFIQVPTTSSDDRLRIHH